MTRDEILGEVTSHYLDSRDFNGISAIKLAKSLGVGWKDIRAPLRELIEDDAIGVLYSDIELNTHILRLGFPPKDVQTSKLDTDDVVHTCVYPRPEHLRKVVDASLYAGEPFKLCLALGEPQLAYRSFDLTVLESYRNDPRYSYRNNDISGSISVVSQCSESASMPQRDHILLQSFGFSYDQAMNRAVATYLRYLSDLSPEHQQIWKAKELTGAYRLHPDYYRNTIVGDWSEKVPIFTAFVSELYIINRMAEAMGRPVLFRQDYGKYGEDKPNKFCFLVRPTLEEYSNFVLLLDKMVSDNLDKRFFQNEVPYESETTRSDGKIVVRQKGTLQILDDWVRKSFRPRDWQPWDESIEALRDVRRQRQKPAHSLDENRFDQRFFKEQRDLIIRAYTAVRTLRLLLANYRAVKIANIEIPEWLVKGEIWTY